MGGLKSNEKKIVGGTHNGRSRWWILLCGVTGTTALQITGRIFLPAFLILINFFLCTKFNMNVNPNSISETIKYIKTLSKAKLVTLLAMSVFL